MLYFSFKYSFGKLIIINYNYAIYSSDLKGESENAYVINKLFSICSFIYKFNEQTTENGRASILNFILNFISIKELNFSLFFILSFN